MVLRGSFFIYTLAEKPRDQYIIDTLTQHEEWNNRRMMVCCGDATIAGGVALPPRLYMYNTYFMHLVPVLYPGEFGISGGMEYGLSRISIFRASELKEKQRANWVAFRERYEDYVIGVSYPRYYHYIFGGWVPGSSLAEFEFPINYIYYIDREANEDLGNPQKYYPLYEIDDWQEYLGTIARVGCTVVLSGNGNLPEDFAREVCSLLSLGSDASLLAEQTSVYIVQTGSEGQKVIFSQSGGDAIFLSLTEIIGAESSLEVSANSNVVAVYGRPYATNGAGLNIVVYDNEMQCVMDWRSLTVNTNSGSVVLRK
jgi:hypothetical protein